MAESSDRDTDQGVEVDIKPENIEGFNIRALGDVSEDVPKAFMLPQRHPLSLLFFRMVFKHMMEECGTLHGKRQTDDAPEKDNEIPIAAFQRCMERLFYTLGDEHGFDAEKYDINHNGCVGWSEFVHVCRHRKIVIDLSIAQRIFLTLDNPDVSYLAGQISAFIIFVISTSSLIFILSTAPDFQDDPVGLDPPKAYRIFDVIELLCLVIFITEYLARLFTCWSHRPEVFDRQRLLALTTGYSTLELPSPFRRVVAFIIAPQNTIDLMAILPGVVGRFYTSFSGGGFVVLRLIRLTRIFKAPGIREPARIIAGTIRRSMKAFYVLAFNLCLGITIFGSLMYLAESGTWNPKDRTYQRYEGRMWNATSLEWVAVTGESPFLSIPHAFWWAMVTATTIGYGDMYPTTSLGYVIAVTTMMFSLLIAALPVGVIGGNFRNVWHEVLTEKKNLIESKQKEEATIKASFQRFAPFESMSKLMLLDVWFERFPKGQSWDELGSGRSPLKGDFMGQVRIELDLPTEEEVRERKLQVPYEREITRQLQPDPTTVNREVTGTITVRYQWTPHKVDPKEVKLSGLLRMTVVSARGLINLNLKAKGATSNPFCMVSCYPTSPAVCGDLVTPCIWKTPATNSLNPQFGYSHDFHFEWASSCCALPKEVKPDWSSLRVPTRSHTGGSVGTALKRAQTECAE